METYPALRLWETEVTVSPGDGVGSQKEEPALGTPI